jgi:competence protein ComGB
LLGKKNMNDGCSSMKRSKWTISDQALFLHRLGELLDHGYPLSHAIQFIGLQETTKKSEALDTALEYLRQGESLYFALSKLKFHNQLISYLYYAENYGNLSTALKEWGGFWKHRTEDMKKVKKLLIYPIFLLFFTGAVFFVLQKVLLPKFQTLFNSMDVEQNIFLIVVLKLSNYLHNFPFVFLSMILLYFFAKYYWFAKKSPLQQRKLLQAIPFVGKLIKLYNTHFFASQMSGLLAGGLSINQSIRLFSENEAQPFYQELCSIIRNDLTEGKPLEEIFLKLPYFERNISIIISNGQKYGTLDQELFHYGKDVLKMIEDSINTALRIVQPILFSIIGLLVISIYLAVLMPMFSLLDGI